jgi:type II secretory pathway predicted ATPase ExeA
MIEFRLRQAGYKGSCALFTNRAVKMIHARTLGYPRKIALLCHEALKVAAVKGMERIDQAVIMKIVAPSVEYEKSENPA